MANSIFGVDLAGAGEAVSSIGSLAKDIRAAITGKSVVDPAAQAALEAKLLEIEAASANAQVSLNQAEAASGKLFVSGWRPFIGWTLGLAILYQFVARPVLLGIFVDLPLVPLAMDELWPMIAGMLGLVGARTYEKAKGVARK